MAKKRTMSVSERVSSGVFPTGISYADRTVEVGGDYKRLAFLPFSTLILEWSAKRVSPDVREYIERDAAKIQDRRGQQYKVSQAGQTVLLGGGRSVLDSGGGKPKAAIESEIKRALGGVVGKKDVEAEIERTVARLPNHRVAIYIEGASKPVYISPLLRQDEADRLADRRREEIRRTGSTHRVRIEPA